MADVNLINSASVTGNYDTEQLTINSNIVTTKIINGLKATMEVDKKEWITGNLTYKITVQNNAEKLFESPVLIDVLDPTLVMLEENSVEVNGVTRSYTYEEISGKLSINLEQIPVGTTSVITFRVKQKQY